jgi:hypothetical protein
VKRETTEIQNITLAIPKSLLRKAKLLAVERNTSISGLLAEFLREIVNRSDAYSRARDQALADLKNPPDLGTFGKITWTREELHERH